MSIYDVLKEEKDHRIKGRLYHHCQCDFAYNSNRIEGNQLTNEETRYLYETHTIIADKNKCIKSDDIIETINHFRAFDYLIDIAQEPLDEKHIKEFHKILKSNTTDSELAWFNVGDYKAEPNVIGNFVETANPKEVKKMMDELICSYNDRTNITENDIIDFHYRFEKIHPFQDGNGRVGRLIMFKECLKNDIIPFIISDETKAFYLRGLQNYEEDKEYLRGTCLAEQDKFIKWCELLRVDYTAQKTKDYSQDEFEF